jgi:phosphocarrier protein
MFEQEVEIKNRAGMHTRPASMIVKVAAKFKSEVYIEKEGINVNAKSIIGVMTLAASKGTKLTIKAEGNDEQDAVNAICELINDGFGEPS